jgi:hypothetical protein
MKKKKLWRGEEERRCITWEGGYLPLHELVLVGHGGARLGGNRGRVSSTRSVEVGRGSGRVGGDGGWGATTGSELGFQE